MSKRMNETETIILPQALTLGLIGHDGAAGEFMQDLRHDHPPHAWLIGGPRGIGKTTFACCAAHVLLSDNAHVQGNYFPERPEGDILSHRMAQGGHMDFFMLQKKGVRFSIEELRELLGLVALSHHESRHKVVLIDPAEHMTEQATNALLKTLEEPPPHTFFLIVSHAPSRLLPTILSRCRRLNLRPLPHKPFATLLQKLTDTTANIDQLYHISGGSVGMALNFVEDDKLWQLIQDTTAFFKTKGQVHKKILELCDAWTSQQEAWHIVMMLMQMRLKELFLQTDNHRLRTRLLDVMRDCAKLGFETEQLNLDKKTALFLMTKRICSYG